MLSRKKEHEYANIMHFLRYNFKNQWAPDSIFNGKSRIWIQAFNELIKEGFIEKQKKYPGYKYRWKAALPQRF